MQKKSHIKQKILQYLEKKEISRYEFYKLSGITRGVLDQPTGINEENIAKFLAYAPDIDPNWLFSEDDIIGNRDILSMRTENAIPLVKTEAIAGIGNMNFVIKESDIQQYYVVPDFKKIDFMIRITGSSMYPKYNSGDIVACRVLKDTAFIQWNKVHVLGTHEQGILIKRVKKGSTPDQWLCVSDNKDYDPFEIPRSEVTGLALVIGVIRLE